MRASWLSIPVTGTDMQRINTAYFYRLAQKLVPLRSLEPNTGLYLNNNYTILSGARNDLHFFVTNTLIPPVTSYGNGNTLLALVAKICDEEYVAERTLEWFEVNAITEALDHFEISLQSDFASRETFIVSPKAAFSTTLLAESGHTVASENCLTLAPQIGKDLADGCRCLVFELPTAAAFHFFRAVEAMVKAYGEFVRGRRFTEREKKGGLGGYANLLKQLDLHVDVRLTNSIEQIAGLHRNPTMHPEMHITKAEIMATLGMSISLIETIGLDWKRRIDTPGTPLIELIPDDSKILELTGDESESNGLGDGSVQSGDEEGTRRVKAGDAKTHRKRKAKNQGGEKAGA